MNLTHKALLWSLACGTLAAAQTSIQPSAQNPSEPLQHGNLIVWFVGQPGPPPPPQPYTQYREQTAGSFGTPASNVGHTASTVGVSPSNFPATATIGSKPASEVGQTAGSFGTASSNIGQTAGSYGQPASSLGAAANGSGTPVFTASSLDWISATSASLGRLWMDTFAGLHSAFRDLQPRLAFVKLEDLQDRLAAVQRSPEFPDILIGAPLPLRSRTFATAAVLAHLGAPSFDLAAMVAGLPQPSDAVILRHAQHPREARAFVVWLSDQACACAPHIIPDTATAPARLALSTAETLLSGGAVTAADPAFADPISPSAAVSATFWPQSSAVLDSLRVHTDVLMAAANERFAVVALRSIAESAGGFGVVHPLVILHRATDGRWRVLQISTDLQGALLSHTFSLLHPYAEPVAPDRLRPVAAITQAAPVDGDTRPRNPELWWDNPGTAGMLLVESQKESQTESQTHAPSSTGSDARGHVRSDAPTDSWTDSHLLLVPDRGSHLQVRVTASFASLPGLYRWRVWSLGNGGMISISPWRRLNVVQ